MKRHIVVVLLGLLVIFGYVNINIDHAEKAPQNIAVFSNQSDNFSFSYNNKEKTASLIKYKGNNSDVDIPETTTYNNVSYKVVQISSKAFKNVDINSLTIPGSVKKIEKNSFVDSKFTNLYINNNQVEPEPFLLLERHIDIDFK